MIQKLTLTALAAVAATGAFAQINAYKVQNLWMNNTGTFSSSGTFPNVVMQIINQSNNTQNSYGERFVAWLSTNGGTTIAKVNGRRDFSVFFNIRLTTDANAVRPVETGILLNYDNHRGFRPTSQFYAKANPGTNPAPAIQTTSDWAIPDYNFVLSQSATFSLGQTILMGLEFDYNPADPNSSTSRLTFRDLNSGWLFSSFPDTRVYDQEMDIGRAGGTGRASHFPQVSSTKTFRARCPFAEQFFSTGRNRASWRVLSPAATWLSSSLHSSRLFNTGFDSARAFARRLVYKRKRKRVSSGSVLDNGYFPPQFFRH